MLKCGSPVASQRSQSNLQKCFFEYIYKCEYFSLLSFLPYCGLVLDVCLGVCVCVTLGIIGILSDCFRFTVVFLV